MIHEEICTYEVCKLAKEKGFPQGPKRNGKCRIYTLNKSKNSYVLCDWAVWISAPWASEVIAAPTQSLLQRWLREEKGIIIELKYSDSTESWRPFWSWCIYNNWGITLEIGDNSATYELALEDALKYALKNLV